MSNRGVFPSIIKAVIFDMDGVLIDSEPVYFQAEKELFRSLDLKITSEIHDSFVGMSMVSIWEIIKKSYYLKPSIEELAEKHKQIMIKGFAELSDPQPINGIIPFLDFLKSSNIQITLASSSCRELVDLVIERTGIKKYFDLTVSGDEILRGKPEPDIFLKVLEERHIQDDEALIIEDSANGIKAAHKAGIFAVGFQNPNSGNQDLGEANLIINQISELHKKLNKQLSGQIN